MTDPTPTSARESGILRAMRRPGFTLIELLVVIATVALLLGLLLPALAGARMQAMAVKGGANLQQIGVALTSYAEQHDRTLPQMRLMPNGDEADGPTSEMFTWLYAGRRSAARVYRAHEIGADRKPLNGYLGDYGPDDEVEVMRDPLDNGTRDKALLSLARTDDDEGRATLYRLLGTSYLLNDHGLDRVPCPFVDIFPTLIPSEGGRMPMVATPSRTWLAAHATIYNYDDGGDQRMRWAPVSGDRGERASMVFNDGHVKTLVEVPAGLENSTPDYTFLPEPRWMERFEHLKDLVTH